ncbi:hypothetical protein [Actinophytocola sp.]|uniref:hypothetical protein n=1 Tax=Actinophytocola sp. TaxID=1872138 RepID=UPI002D7F604B|nr:hypothetical protein [Actinophytocola sp.]HET9144089.1 hypothetical protein [Actinophytocola sp.]
MATADHPQRRVLDGVARFGHSLPALAALTLVLSVPSWLHIDALYPYTSPACFIAAILMFLSLTHTVLPEHDCQRCDRARGHTPQDVADRQLWTFWFSHRLDEQPSLTWGCLIAGVIVTNTAVHVTGVTLLYIPLDLGFTAMCWSTWRHFLFAPWCAYCRDGGGGGWDGDHERIPDPEPVGQGTR